MIRLGVISNRNSDGNGGESAIADFVSSQKDVMFADPDSVDEIPAVMRAFAKKGVNMIAVDGGDGTIRDVLSAIEAGFGKNWPPLALIPSGKTNLIARDVGSFGTGLKGARRLLRMVREDAQFYEVDLPLLEAVREGLPPLRGMFFGAGVFSYATRMAGVWTFNRGIKQSWGVALTMARILWRYVRGKRAGKVMAIGEGAAAEPHFIVLATTLRRLMLGLWPFPDVGSGPVHWLAVVAPPRGLLSAVFVSWLGKIRRRPGYDGGNAETLPIRLRSAFVVDGELYQPDENGVILRPGPLVHFVSVNGRYQP